MNQAQQDQDQDLDPTLLAPPVVAALRDDAAAMQRSLSEDIREEREELREAAEQTLNVIMDLNLDGTIRWVSPSWLDVLGTQTDSVQGCPIADLIASDNKSCFIDVVESMKQDDSRSQIVRFAMLLGPHSKLLPADETASSPVIELEAQGIMVYDTASGGESHTMWMIRPWIAPREIKFNLPALIVESLGSGAEILASYLTQLAESGLEDPGNLPPPNPVLCRICERQIPPWWFEKHTDLCLQEHTAEMDVQMSQESLTEHRHAIVKVLDALEARKSRSLSGDVSPLPLAEYKGLPIGPPPTMSPSSATSSPSPANGRSRDRSSGFGHARARSFAVRRPQARIVELLLDLCDTALEISTPAIKEAPVQAPGELRTQSPQSESRILQVTQWQSPSTNTLEQEQGLAVLCADTEKVAKAKVEAVLRHRRVIEYAERIRIEFSVIVQDCIDAAMRKAARIASGVLSDSSEDELSSEELEEEGCDEENRTDGQYVQDGRDGQEEGEGPDLSHSGHVVHEEAFFAGSFDAPSTLAMALERAKISDDPECRRMSTAADSARSASPRECPTPKSIVGATGAASHMDSRRESILFESDAGDSDGSMRSSVASRPPPRTESPISEFSDLRRQASSRQHRRSLILPGAVSPRRQESPSRPTGQQPSSPLRISKPRGLPFPSSEGVASPEASPMLPSSDFGSPSLTANMPLQPSQSHHHHLHHHRRQSSMSLSVAGDNSSRLPPSPRLSAVGAPPMARAVPPSIKDFEVIKPISKGAFGSVYLSKKKSTGEYFAIKVLKKADMVAKNQVTNVKAERAIMMWQGESDFVAKLYWTFSSKDYLYLVMEYLSGGDCASLIKVLGCLPEEWVKKYLGEVVLGVEHLHSRGIVHRDLKPDNLLIDQRGHLKLTDFGLSRMGLIGRQKRALNSGSTEPVPDLLKQGPFARSASITSSRSTSLDLHGVNSGHSPGGTPLMAASDSGSSLNLVQPSYFSLSNFAQEPRRFSGQRSDSGGSDALSHMISNLSLNDTPSLPSANVPIPLPVAVVAAPPGEGSEVRGGDASPDLASVQTTASAHGSITGDQLPRGTPPQPSMPPPNWALFDPEDTNRRFVGTPDYLAPETIKGEPQDETSDWWSVGCIMFEFLYGIPPFNASEADQVFENILARRIHWPDPAEDEVSEEAKDLINKLLCSNPRDRLGANRDEKFVSGGEEIRSHSWFKDVNWETLLQDVAQFVPQLENPEDTEYFDSRGATLQSFTEEMEDQSSSPSTSNADYTERPHDALSRVRTQANSIKRGLMPLHIPPHVRDLKSRRLSEPNVNDDFGNFAFKNLPVLEKANKDVIQKLRAEALASQNKQQQAGSPLVSPASTSAAAAAGANNPASFLDGSIPTTLPTPIGHPVQRTLSNAKASQRPQSPSGLSQANSSPSRVSQPSSPLLVSFHAAPEIRRKTSNNGSSLLQQSSTNTPTSSSGSLQPVGASSGGSSGSGSGVGGTLADAMTVPRVPPSLQKAATTISATSSAISAAVTPLPIKGRGSSGISTPLASLPVSPQKLSTPRQPSHPASRSRSLTVGSQEGSPVAPDILSHRNRRSQVFDMSPSSSDNEGDKANALRLRVQRRRQSSRRMSQIALDSGPMFRPLDVLICEDHPVSRMVMEKLLEKLRCRTISASTGPEAVRYAMSDIKFDIIFMEYKLPQISGADVARMIRDTTNTNSHTPIVAITAYLKELQARQHFDSLIEKPISSSKLTEVLSNLCQWKMPGANQSTKESPSMSSLTPLPPFPPLPQIPQLPQLPPPPLAHPIPSNLRRESLRSRENNTINNSPISAASSIFTSQRPGSGGGIGGGAGSSFPSSSREDSTKSSLLGDSDSVSTDDAPSAASQKGLQSGWDDGGLGISQSYGGASKRPQLVEPASASASELASATGTATATASKLASASILDPTPSLRISGSESSESSAFPLLDISAPPMPVPAPQRSLEKLRAKREAIERRRHDSCVDSADDEDDELGLGSGGGGTELAGMSGSSSSSGSSNSSSGSCGRNGGNGASGVTGVTGVTGIGGIGGSITGRIRQHFRSKSVLPSSKLGIEMMRANSHDSVIIAHTGSSESAGSTVEPVTQLVTPTNEEEKQLLLLQQEQRQEERQQRAASPMPSSQPKFFDMEMLSQQQEPAADEDYDEADATVIHNVPESVQANADSDKKRAVSATTAAGEPTATDMTD